MAEQNAPPATGFDSSQIYVLVKGLETKVNNLLREVDLIKNDFMKKTNDMKKEVKSMDESLIDFKHEQEKTLQKIDLIIGELKQTAGIEEINILKRYVDFWNPMNFVTQRDLDRAIETKIELLSNAKKSEKE